MTTTLRVNNKEQVLEVVSYAQMCLDKINQENDIFEILASEELQAKIEQYERTIKVGKETLRKFFKTFL